ncbi:MAG: BON domain-containing protein [Gammaproteobacteria bacterium]
MDNRLEALCAAAVAGLLLAGPGCASGPERASTGEYLDGSVITMKVKAAIGADEELKATEINVESFKGQVQLSGFVRDPAHISRAIEVTRKIEGVKGVINSLVVKA